MDKKHCKTFISLILLTMAFMVFGISSVLAASPTIDKTTLIVRANSGFYLDKASNTTKYGWKPEVDMVINGPIANGGQVVVDMTTPDGKPWVTFENPTQEIEAGQVMKIEGSGRDLPWQKQSAATGLYGLKIGLKNELQGTNQTLFTGKFKVGKAFESEPNKNKDNYRWYVDYDWALPIAEVYSRDLVDNVGNVEEMSPLVATFWFRGDVSSEAVAYLFHNGKEISNTQNSSKGTSLREQGISLFDQFAFTWSKMQFIFTNSLVYNHENPDNHPNAFRLDKNPGEYEVKVLRKGKLVRAAKFMVGSDGKIVDNGLSKQNELGTRRMTILATVTGDEDGVKADSEAWRTGAFYANPLKGFGQ